MANYLSQERAWVTETLRRRGKLGLEMVIPMRTEGVMVWVWSCGAAGIHVEPHEADELESTDVPKWDPRNDLVEQGESCREMPVRSSPYPSLLGLLLPGLSDHTDGQEKDEEAEGQDKEEEKVTFMHRTLPAHLPDDWVSETGCLNEGEWPGCSSLN